MEQRMFNYSDNTKFLVKLKSLEQFWQLSQIQIHHCLGYYWENDPVSPSSKQFVKERTTPFKTAISHPPVLITSEHCWSRAKKLLSIGEKQGSHSWALLAARLDNAIPDLVHPVPGQHHGLHHVPVHLPGGGVLPPPCLLLWVLQVHRPLVHWPVPAVSLPVSGWNCMGSWGWGLQLARAGRRVWERGWSTNHLNYNHISSYHHFNHIAHHHTTHNTTDNQLHPNLPTQSREHVQVWGARGFWWCWAL